MPVRRKTKLSLTPRRRSPRPDTSSLLSVISVGWLAMRGYSPVMPGYALIPYGKRTLRPGCRNLSSRCGQIGRQTQHQSFPCSRCHRDSRMGKHAWLISQIVRLTNPSQFLSTWEHSAIRSPRGTWRVFVSSSILRTPGLSKSHRYFAVVGT
jgi:hypothetical protein